MQNQNMLDLFLPLNTEQSSHLKKLEDTCSNIQCAWLSGYFWKVANQSSNLPSPIPINKHDRENVITIVSASQTGNAKILSERLHEYFQKNDKDSHLINALDYKFKKIQEERILILIISTQGEGEPPEEALSFYKFIMSKKAPKLNDFYYSIFGLGDTSYNFFCQSGKDFDKRFKELGGKSLLKRFDADIEYEDDYIKWSKELLISLDKNCLENKVSVSSTVMQKSNSMIHKSSYNKKNPAQAVVLINQKITGRNSNKDIHHIEIDIQNLDVNYIPGDALGIWYKNDTNLVKKILELFSIEISEKVTIKNNVITIFDALKNHFELTNNTKNIVKNYAVLTNNHFLKEIISNNTNFENYVINNPFVNMIDQYPSKLSSEELITLLRPLTPRLYSISSSQQETNNEVHITVGVVKKLISGQWHFGGASGYLSQSLKTDDIIKIFIETNNNFRLPSNKDIPIIMIGAGTGIAPFRSFMQERDNNGSRGKNWIFFGNPCFTEDFLYQIEWQQYIKKGLLNKMSLAWSQDQKHKIYVQDKIRENGEELWSWIKEEKAQIYICGNASKMAKDVEKALLDIISKYGSMNYEDADEFLNTLRLNKRYQRDIY